MASKLLAMSVKGGKKQILMMMMSLSRDHVISIYTSTNYSNAFNFFLRKALENIDLDDYASKRFVICPKRKKEGGGGRQMNASWLRRVHVHHC